MPSVANRTKDDLAKRSMKDIKIFKKCQKCNHWLTLMESVRGDNDKPYVGTRCLSCGYSGFTELWEVVYKAELIANDKNPFSTVRENRTTEEKCKNCELKEYLVVAITNDGKCRDCGKELLPNFSL